MRLAFLLGTILAFRHSISVNVITMVWNFTSQVYSGLENFLIFLRETIILYISRNNEFTCKEVIVFRRVFPSFLITVFITCMCSVPPAQVSAAEQQNRTHFSVIDEAYARGTIDYEAALVQKVLAIFQPEKLDARFRDHTMRLFEKHGIQNVAYWHPTDEPDSRNVLIYIIKHGSRDAAKKSWGAFGADPQWKKARDESGVGRLAKPPESTYMKATDYSQIK